MKSETERHGSQITHKEKGMEYEDTIEITYTVLGYDEAGETSFDMDISEHDLEWMQNAEDEGEFLDSDFISENRIKLHKKILKAIRDNMEELGMDIDDGMVEKRYASIVKEYHLEASHSDMHEFAEDDDIEYTVML